MRATATLTALLFLAASASAQVYPGAESYPGAERYPGGDGTVVYPESHGPGGEVFDPNCVDGQGGFPGGFPQGESYGGGPIGLEYPGFIGDGNGNDSTYPYDQQDPWLHGYHQEIPAYGGYGHFRPYNYRHVLAQTQVAAGWGLSRTMPYSQQFWHRYHARAALEHCPLPARAYDEYRNDSARYAPQRDDATAGRMQGGRYAR